MIQKFSNLRPNTLKKLKNSSNNVILSIKKGLIHYFLCIKPMPSIWLQGKDLNLRPPGYGPDELPTALPCDVITIIKSV